MKRSPATRMVEDYVTLIWKAHEWPGGEPSTTDLAAQLGVTPSTVSANLKRLARDGLISYVNRLRFSAASMRGENSGVRSRSRQPRTRRG